MVISLNRGEPAAAQVMVAARTQPGGGGVQRACGVGRTPSIMVRRLRVPGKRWLFEHMHSDKAPLCALLLRLRTLGYHTFSSGFDTTCVQAAELMSFRWLLWIEKVHPAWLSPPR